MYWLEAAVQRERKARGERILQTHVLWEPAPPPLLMVLKYIEEFPEDQMRTIREREPSCGRCLTSAQEEDLERQKDHAHFPSNWRICIRWPAGN